MQTPGKRQSFPFRLALFALAQILAIGALAGCAGPRLETITSPAETTVTLDQTGIRLTISPNAWNGYPSDLYRHYTPVLIRIQNDRSEEIQIRYADFLALDEARNQYRAVAPAEVAYALFGSRGPEGDHGRGQARWARPGDGLSASRDAWWGYPYWPYYSFGPPFSFPFYPYPYYGPEYPYGWPRTTSYDILTLGLREGRVLPDARVEGFLFLQQATQRGNLLTVTWTPATADGKPLPAFSAQFRIVR
ncbi:MAG TPA: hypothetical protein VEU07_08705 [Candidatus Acidoferrum sp.]|nr:hypothetical protein [Candidatus Acidoferrum sp.]